MLLYRAFFCILISHSKTRYSLTASLQIELTPNNRGENMRTVHGFSWVSRWWRWAWLASEEIQHSYYQSRFVTVSTRRNDL